MLKPKGLRNKGRTHLSRQFVFPAETPEPPVASVRPVLDCSVSGPSNDLHVRLDDYVKACCHFPQNTSRDS